MTSIDDFDVKMFADGADIAGIAAAAEDPLIKGFTTNPTLMRQAGVDNYEQFALKALEVIDGKPISFEVFTDDFDEMRRQAPAHRRLRRQRVREDPRDEQHGCAELRAHRPARGEGVSVNVTAVFTRDADRRRRGRAGRRSARLRLGVRRPDRRRRRGPDANRAPRRRSGRRSTAGRGDLGEPTRGAQRRPGGPSAAATIITMTDDLLKKLPGLARTSTAFSLETVQMFRGTRSRRLRAVSVGVVRQPRRR